MNTYLIFDIGGTGVKWSVADEGGGFLQSGTAPSHPDDFPQFLNELEAVYKAVPQAVSGIAISSPGFVDPVNGIVRGASSVPCIHEFPLAAAISKRLGGLPVSMENDGNCAALGEYLRGTGMGKKSVAAVVCGSGIGGGYVNNGKIVPGVNHASSEFGFMPLGEADGEVFSWSRWSVVNTVNAYNKKYGQSLTAPQLFAAKTDTPAGEFAAKFFHYLAVGLLCISFALDPELIVVGGAISESEHFLPKVEAALTRLKTQDQMHYSSTPVAVSMLGNRANQYGALYNLLFNGSCKTK